MNFHEERGGFEPNDEAMLLEMKLWFWVRCTQKYIFSPGCLRNSTREWLQMVVLCSKNSITPLVSRESQELELARHICYKSVSLSGSVSEGENLSSSELAELPPELTTSLEKINSKLLFKQLEKLLFTFSQPLPDVPPFHMAEIQNGFCYKFRCAFQKHLSQHSKCLIRS